MLPVGFEPTISADERPQTYALDRAATGTGEGREYRVEKKQQKIEEFLYVLSNTVLIVHFKKDWWNITWLCFA